MPSEETIRESFERLIKSGSYGLTYNLQQSAGGEYFSVYTEEAWRFYKKGWLKKDGL